MIESNGPSGHLHSIVSLTERCWPQMAGSRLPSRPVVEDHDVFRYLAICQFAG